MKMKLPSRICLLLMGLIVTIQAVQANPISRQQALQNAHEFLMKKGVNVKNATMRQVPAFKGGGTSGNAPYYVFNIGDGNGFVIASGDDCAYEILGYADKGHFDANNLPDGLQYMLDFYAEQIESGSKSPKVSEPKSTPSYPAVEPLLTTKWGQDEPYKDNCPIDAATGKRCVTGCVATAMAQVMYYHRNHSTREVMRYIPSYTTTARGIDVEGIPKGSPIDWDNMLDTYDSNATEVQRQAVANLMLYCGVSVEMNYGPYSSGSNEHNVSSALRRYFDYDNAIFRERSRYTSTEWETMVYEDLGKGNPILYCGGIHAFVVDGHDGNGFVHINWGWDGSYDSFYRLTPTYPGEQTMHGFSSNQEAFFSTIPNGYFPRLTTTELSLTSSDLVENLSSLSSIPVTMAMTVTNLTDETQTFEQAVGLCTFGSLDNVVSPISTINGMAPGATQELSVSLELENTLMPGVYTLVPISRALGSDKWRQNINNDQFITMSIYGDNAHLTLGEPEEESDIITFACDEVGRTCIALWDWNGDGALSKDEAAMVESLYEIFQNNTKITSFDELQYFTGLTTIESYEFENCTNLSSIILPPNLQTIGARAFSGCSKLQQITIPRSVTSIGNFAFAGISEQRYLRVENSNPCYYSDENNTAIIETATRTLVLGSTNTIIPNDVVAIGLGAFSSCTGLESIQIPESVTSIGIGAFSNCSNLTTINIPESVTTIGSSAFSSCSALTEITIPSSVTSIGDYAFSQCSGLTSVHLLGNVTSIGNSTFSSCSALTSFTIPSSVTSIGDYAFSGCSSLPSITIPSSVTCIGYGAFRKCTGLTSVTIPSSVSAIDRNPFSGCSGLQRIVVDAGNPYYHSNGNNTAIIKTATKTLAVGIANAIIPNDVVAIGKDAFYECSGLTSLVIPDGVTSIGSSAFYNCSNLQSINIPSGVTSIGYNTFLLCSKLTAITIPSSVTSIGYSAFEFCSALESIDIQYGVTSIGSRAFSGCGMASINIPSSVTSMGESAFSGCKNLTDVTIPTSLTSISEGAFRQCSALAVIDIPSSVTRIGNYAFYDCSSLESVNIPSSITQIGGGAFGHCTKLTDIIIPSSVTNIGSYAFCGCTGLTSIKSYITNVFKTGSYAFYDCQNVTLYVPEGLVDDYMSTPDWNSLWRIKEMPIILDVNGDGSNNIADVVCVIDKILGTSSNDSYNYDVNNDEHINIGDVITLVDAIVAQ